MATEIHSLVTEENLVDQVLFTQVTDLLKVSTEAQLTMVDSGMVPEYTLTGVLASQYETLVGEMLAQRDCLARMVQTANHPLWWPRTTVQGSESDGLYCLRYAVPTATGKCNLWALKLARARRTGSHWDEVTAATSLFPGVNRPHWSYTMTEYQLYNGTANVITLENLPTLQMHGMPMTSNQLPAAVVVALPMSLTREVLSTGRLPHGLFTHSQVNLWFTARSSLLRLCQMYWGTGITLTPEQCDEQLGLIVFNPELSRLSGRSVHTAAATDATSTAGSPHRLLTFNRQWLDHCFSTDSLEEDFMLTPTEMASGLGIQLSFSLNQLTQMKFALSDGRPFGLQGHGLLGHLVLPLSVLNKYNSAPDDCKWTTIYGTDEMHEDEGTAGQMTTDGLNVTLGNVPLGHCLTITVSKK